MLVRTWAGLGEPCGQRPRSAWRGMAAALRPAGAPGRRSALEMGGFMEKAPCAASKAGGLWVGGEEERRSKQRDQRKGGRQIPVLLPGDGAASKSWPERVVHHFHFDFFS